MELQQVICRGTGDSNKEGIRTLRVGLGIISRMTTTQEKEARDGEVAEGPDRRVRQVHRSHQRGMKVPGLDLQVGVNPLLGFGVTGLVAMGHIHRGREVWGCSNVHTQKCFNYPCFTVHY